MSDLEERVRRLEEAIAPETIYVVVRNMEPAAVYRDRIAAERQCDIWARGAPRCLANAAVFTLVLQ
jgi:ABC-type enterochelin transport system ATPase subunit